MSQEKSKIVNRKSAIANVLVIDKEPIIGASVKAALEAVGHTVVAVASEAEAIEALRQPFDVVFVHRGLPDSTCDEIVRAARAHDSVAIILMSSERSEQTEKNKLRLGADEIVYKPLDPLDLRAVVERRLNQEKAPVEVPGSPRILVVDDDEIVVRSAIDTLKSRFEVTGTQSPQEALRILKASPCEILLADLMMEEMYGMDLIRAAKNVCPSLLAIVMTGHASKDTAVEALKEGAYDFLEKPLSPDIVTQTVVRAWKALRTELENRKLLTELRQTNEELLLEIEERKRAEEGLLESESRFREMAELLPTVIWEMDAGLRITYTNNLGLQTFGYTQEELDAGINGMDLLHPDDREAATRDIEQIVKGVDIGTMDYRMLRKDGSEIFTLVHAAPIHKGGRIAGFRVSVSDITEQKRLQRRLHQSRKMQAIATLAGGVAHEFNNALSAITGYTGLLETEFPDNGKIMDYVKPMKESARRMARLTGQLLAYARGGRYNLQTMLLSEYVKSILPMIRHTLEPNIRVETDLPPDIPNVEADQTQMQMVLSAIMANAKEAIEGPGRIRITTRNVEVDQDFIEDYPGLKLGRYVCLSIEDDGKGMDKETKNRIFEPFFTTHFMGRGLGMASVYGIVMNHGGSITVDSELGKGTIVRIYLPTISAGRRERGAKVVKTPEVELPRGEGTVLVIEDEEPLVKLFRKILEMLGYRVLQARTGEEAVEIAGTFDGDIDLALLDIKLPDMEGGRVYPLIMEARPNLKVIVCSGYSIDGPAQEILDAGAQAFIQKPFSISTLADKLKEVLEGKIGEIAERVADEQGRRSL